MAYAPSESPEIAVAVIAENGGSGSGTAAPIARKVLDAYLLPRLGIDPEVVAEENTPAVVPEDEE